MAGFSFWSKLSISYKIAAVSFLATAACVGTVAVVVRNITTQSAITQAQADMATLVAERASQAQRQLDTVASQMSIFAQRPDVIDAAAQFVDAFALVADEAGKTKLTVDAAPLSNFYANEFGRRAAEAGLSPMPTAALVPQNDSGRILQHLYIAENPHPVGSKLDLQTAKGELTYNRVHTEIHPALRRELDAFGFYDIFVIDLDGNVVYTVYKEVDFASNVTTGTWKDSGLAEAFRRARSLPPSKATLVDFAPYTPSYGAAAAFIASPIYRDDKVVAVACIQMPVGRLNDLFANEQGLGRTGETYLVGRDGKLRSQARLTEEPTIFVKSLPEELAPLAAGTQPAQTIATGLHGEEAVAAFVPLDFLGLGWGVIGEMTMDVVNEPVRELQFAIAGVGSIVAVLAAVPALLLGGMIRKPIMEVVNGARALGSGSVQTRINDTRRDELGDLARAVNGVFDTIGSVVGEVSAFTARVVGACDNIFEQNREALNLVDTQKKDVSAVSAAIEELAASVASIETQCVDADRSSKAAGETATEGAGVILETVTQIRGIADTVRESVAEIEKLDERSARIGEFTQVIDDIADQTNLLALNAAIEAARAGEHGRGFAVVADEVRKLAERTTSATKEIADTISAMRHEVAHAVGSIKSNAQAVDSAVTGANAASDSVNQIIGSARNISELIANIAAAVSQQAPAAQYAAESVQRIDTGMANLQRTTQTTGDHAAEVSKLGGELGKLTAKFGAHNAATAR